MSYSKIYLFTSTRLGFRNWTDDDIEPMAVINRDPEVMEYFPATQSLQETERFIERMKEQLVLKGFCYYAVDNLNTGELIGFTGLSEKDFESDFTPCIDIGWRFGIHAWNKGFATEAAKRCLQHGFQQLGMERIISIAPIINVRSIAVMKKVDMKFEKTFQHPLLVDNERLITCVLYSFEKKDFLSNN